MNFRVNFLFFKKIQIFKAIHFGFWNRLFYLNNRFVRHLLITLSTIHNVFPHRYNLRTQCHNQVKEIKNKNNKLCKIGGTLGLTGFFMMVPD